MALETGSETITAIDEAAAQAFAASLGGALLRPGDEGYDRARRLYNGMIDRRPALVARCAGTGDVIKSIRFAREQGMPVSVRAGGHNVAGTALCDGGLTIDLSAMTAVRVDPAARTARAEGGGGIVARGRRREPEQCRKRQRHAAQTSHRYPPRPFKTGGKPCNPASFAPFRPRSRPRARHAG